MSRRHFRFLLVAAFALAGYAVVAWLFLVPAIRLPPSVAIETVGADDCASSAFIDHIRATRGVLFTPLQLIPEALLQRLRQQEDGFYHHAGVDWLQILRAARRDLESGEVRYGASTLTMQLMRELFLGKERTLLRKAREVAYALQAERQLSKSEILELYLNVVHWGPGIHGIGTAACYYFQVRPQELSRTQSEQLVALLPNPDGRGVALLASEQAMRDAAAVSR